MAINSQLIRKPSDKNLFLLAAILFPLLVLIGYFKSYYFVSFFSQAQPIANSLVHLHGIVMSLWVIYFTAQIILIRIKNIKLHMTMGWVGVFLAVIVVGVGLATAYDSHIIRHTAPPGISPYSFLIIPIGDLLMFVLFFSGAVFYRKKPFEHKTLMLMTAINFAAPAIARIPLIAPEHILLWAFGVPCLLAITCFAGISYRQRKLNLIFGLAVLSFVVLQPLRIMISSTNWWIQLMTQLFG